MTYWSNAQIPQIELAESKLDTILRILPKQVSSVGAYTVTATSYALLAYVENRAPEVELESIQMFLQEQHINIGGFYSSQVSHASIFNDPAQFKGIKFASHTEAPSHLIVFLCHRIMCV